ncbi:hypothetical protein AYO44_12155 [Planctomycetaceae bacterium SCGC AG-212-F19]|nr:hypothetical protein AYO44_12155 [Planctomycetaceae bacterium SCGC AG-212-F19]
MTEQEWLSCSDPQLSLEFLRGKASDRKLQMFACACARLMPHLMAVPQLAQLVEIAERNVDGAALDAELLIAMEAALHLPHAPRKNYTEVDGGYTHYDIVEDGGIDLSYSVEYFRTLHHREAVEGALWTTFAVWKESWPKASRGMEQVQRATLTFATSCDRGYHLCRSAVEHWFTESPKQAALLRDIFNSPFRPIAVDSRWRTSTVTSLAQGIYDKRAFDRMPILADALEDSGCDNAEVLNHCRQPGVHVRGCLLIDLLLGKE